MYRYLIAGATTLAMTMGTALAQSQYSTSQSSASSTADGVTRTETTKSFEQKGRRPVETDEWTVDSTTTTRPVVPPVTMERSTTTVTRPVAPPPVINESTRTTTTTTTTSEDR